jgi:glutamate-ammonia-ligase adenylyltransferase
MRLRPSGRQGPVATSFQAFCDYQRNEAWTWEHLALTRARPVAGAPALGERVEVFRRALLKEKADPAKIAEAVQDMRARLADAKPAKGIWDGRLGPGRGQDIELLASAAALVAGSPETRVPLQMRAGVEAGWLREVEAGALIAAYDLFRRVQVAAKLLSDRPVVPEDLGAGGCDFFLRATGADSAGALAQRLEQVQAETEKTIEAVLSRGKAGT